MLRRWGLQTKHLRNTKNQQLHRASRDAERSSRPSLGQRDHFPRSQSVVLPWTDTSSQVQREQDIESLRIQEKGIRRSRGSLSGKQAFGKGSCSTSMPALTAIQLQIIGKEPRENTI